jgi:hypothetical protein
LATAHTSISAPYTQARHAISFLTSAAPQGISRLAACLESLPEEPWFAVADLDAILTGTISEGDRDGIDDGLYLRYMLPLVSWWVYVAEALTFGNTQEGIYADPAQAEKRAEVLALLPAVFSSYTAALASTMYYADAVSPDAHTEFLKRYRMLTKHIGGWASEVWPNSELEWLLEHV